MSGMSSPRPPSGFTPRGSYFDPEAADTSEQEFSASLESTGERPQFVVDEPEIPRTRTEETLIAGDSSAELDKNAPPGESQLGTDELGEDEQATPERDSDWREQVSAKVNKYKSQSRHKVRYPSLQLPFEPGPYYPKHENAPRAALSFSESIAAEIVALRPVAESEPPRISLEATARVLEFPRPIPVPVDPDVLADPILDRPRIVEAPELLPPPPAMGGIMMETPSDPEPERRPGFDVPLQSAPLSRRIWAGAIDGLLIAIALAVFAYCFVRITGATLPWQTSWKIGATLLALFWPAYEYAFLVFSETTPGLRLAKLEVQRFDGTPAPRNLRRWRVLASLLSAFSLGLGYAWCFLDEDQLSWHDRITRTHLAPQRSR
jgi:uncharacterized RDD family membrane protein YckC